jgi:hypothetical protein
MRTRRLDKIRRSVWKDKQKTAQLTGVSANDYPSR